MLDYTDLTGKIARGEWHFDLAHGDYHNHTYYSDGLYSPDAVVKRAVSLGLSEIAITDHDGLRGIREAQQSGKEQGIAIVPGVELSTRMENNVGLHILGYGIDIDNPALNERLQQILDARTDRNRRLIAALQAEGFDIAMEEIYDRPEQTYIGKPNIARVLIRKGYAPDMETVFRDILGMPSIKAVKKERLDPAEGIRLILAAGGIAVWAHPGKTKKIGEKGSEEFYANVEKILGHLEAAGLAGMECYYPKHDQAMTERFLAIAAAHDLLVTKGSDFHGD
ncbi:MAG: PHP domain-containing protein [Clostridiales bacterium]|nr:PHP domain-containing protein [Clostridiales bacterium]